MNEDKKRLFNAILSLKTLEDCDNFFQDVCTIQELQDLCDRLKTADLLNQGKTYEEIISETNMSSTTIARVNKALHHGHGGYKQVLSNKNK